MGHHAVAGIIAALLTIAAAAQDPDALTPTGAQRAGNADGTIPKWTGGLMAVQWPKGFKPGGPLLDPFADDRPLFTLTAANYKEHAANLSAGHLALFAKYADYRMPVYPTRRSVSFPEAIYAATAANRNRARLKGIDAVEGVRLGIPFPEPRSGSELLWNHRLRYHGDSAIWHYRRAFVEADGSGEHSQALERVLYGYANARHPAEFPADNAHSYTLLYLSPAEIYPNCVVLWHDAVNAMARRRQNWTAAEGRSWRWPPVGYDEVGMFSHRVRYFDMLDMFNGALDRYVFKLAGRRELIVPYNSFRADRLPLKALAKPRFLAPEALRYEMHRVWVVEATLRPGEAHSIARRVFYLDEDSWSILLADDYDAEGRLSRFQEGHLLPLYPVQGVDYAPVTTYDLQDDRYFADRVLAESPPIEFDAPLSKSDFAPAAARKPYKVP